MRINETVNIKTFIIETLKNKTVHRLLEIGQDLPQSNTTSQLSQLIKSVNLYPLLFRLESTPESLLSLFLKSSIMPAKPEFAAQWLKERHADKSLIETLQQLSLATNSLEENTKIKAALMLLAEQKTTENQKPGETHWVFPFSENTPSLAQVCIKKKQEKKHKKTSWSITINLTLSKNRQLSATARLQDNNLELAFSTDSKELAKELNKSWPILEAQLKKHHLFICTCNIKVVETPPPIDLKPGLNIQV